MIVKVKRECQTDAWFYLDRVASIQVSSMQFANSHGKIPLSSDELLICDNAYNAFTGCEIRPESDAKMWPYTTLECTLDSGVCKVIKFDTVAYLINDNGKTIDKITVTP